MSDADWHAIYLPERDNVRAALDWALGGDGDPIIGIALAGASAALWAELSLPGEGQQRLEAAIAQVESRHVEIGPGSSMALVGVAPVS